MWGGGGGVEGVAPCGTRGPWQSAQQALGRGALVLVNTVCVAPDAASPAEAEGLLLGHGVRATARVNNAEAVHGLRTRRWKAGGAGD